MVPIPQHPLGAPNAPDATYTLLASEYLHSLPAPQCTPDTSYIPWQPLMPPDTPYIP